jgi:uncharacterized protein (TIGR03382 family)
MALRLQNRARMRRALLAAGVAIPQVVLAVTAGSGQVLDTTNFNSTNGVSYINKAQCGGSDSVHLQWNITALSGAAFGLNDVYKIFASNKAPTASNGGTFCAESNDTNTSTSAGQVDSTAATLALQSLDVSGVTMAAKANVPCDTSNEGTNVFVCTHWYDSSGTTRKGFAIGTFQVQVKIPGVPTNVTVTPGDGKLNVSWQAGIGETDSDHYVAEAFLHGTTQLVATETTTGTSATITGLSNDGPTYDVDVIAYSVGGNPSAASAKVLDVKPIPSADFWDVYKDRGGVEQGGCASGSAGTLALLGVASLVALRRRKS